MQANWGPVRTTLRGVLRTEFRYGPPSYGRSPWDDSVETPIILTLHDPLTVLPDPPTGEEGDYHAQGFEQVPDVQVAILSGPDQRLNLEVLAGAMVEVTGELYAAHTGHHHRSVLIACNADDIKLILPFSHASVPNARVLTGGSGILLDGRGHILTARHVARGQALSVRRRLDRREARLVAMHPELDIAILQADIHCSHRVAVRSILGPTLGERVYAAGYPVRSFLGHGVSFTEGVVSSDRINREGCFHFSAPIQPGNSGGPILDAHGNLLAIIVSQAFPDGHRNASDIRQIQLLNEAIPLVVLGNFLAEHKIDVDMSPIMHRVPLDVQPATQVADIAEKICLEVESWSVVGPASHEELPTVHDLMSW